MNNINDIRILLQKSAQETPPSKGVYFKTAPGDYAHHDQFMGVTVPNLRKIAKDFYELSLPEIQIFLESRINEERFFALIILNYQYQKMPEKIYQFYIKNLQHINNWNLVDASAHLIIGAHLLEKDKNILLNFVNSNIMWERRIAIVSTWYFIKNNQLEWTFKLTLMLMNDSHDLIHKATGWMLREAGKKNVHQLISFLNRHASSMPRTMLRYAIEKFSPEDRKIYLSYSFLKL